MGCRGQMELLSAGAWSDRDCLKTDYIQCMHCTYLGSVPHRIKCEKIILSNLISVTEVFQASL